MPMERIIHIFIAVMRIERSKALVSIFFLLVFLSSKVSLFHDLTHEHNHDHVLQFGHMYGPEHEHEQEQKNDDRQDSNSSECEICISFLANQFTPTNFETLASVDNINYEAFNHRVVAIADNNIYNTSEKNSLHTRPPPFC